MSFWKSFLIKNTLFNLKLKIFFTTYISFALLLLITRFAIWKAASHYFAELTSAQVQLSFLHGMRFDLHVLALLLCPFLVLFMLPYRRKIIIKIFTTVFLFLFVMYTFFLAGDVIFFSIFNNHIGVEIFTSFTHIGFFIQLAFQTYYYITIPLFLLLAFGLFAIHRYIDRYPINKTDTYFLAKSIVILICLIPFIFLTLKGKLQIHGRNISMMDAQVLSNARAKDLILNGLYTTMNAIRKHQQRKLYFDNPFDGLKIITPQEKQIDPTFAFERQRISFNKPNKNYNFVLFILESFDPMLIEEEPQVIPNFMEIKNGGTYFPNFFSSGGRSLIGVTATLFSVPYVWGLPTMKNGLGGKEFSRLASYFNNQGYNTINVITDIPSSDNANLMASYMGFDQFFSKVDIPLRHDYPSFHKGFDYEGLEFLLDKMSHMQKPFFAYFYSSTLHNPYQILISKDYQPYPMDTEKHQFLNRAAYTDAALGNFWKQAREKPWFKNTIFLFLPDHRAPLANRDTYGPHVTHDKFHSFLLMYGPGIPAQTSAVFANQEDILPTLIDLLNSSASYSASGQSVLDPYRAPYKFIFEENDNTIHVIGPRLQETVSEANLSQPESLSDKAKEALQFNEAIYKSIHDNRWKQK